MPKPLLREPRSRRKGFGAHAFNPKWFPLNADRLDSLLDVRVSNRISERRSRPPRSRISSAAWT
jgi:hypothetical protein